MGPDLNTLRNNAYSAAGNVSAMQAGAPSLLNDLKQNLLGVFTKDNPIINARTDALSNYLATPDRTRAEILAGNIGDVPGVSGRQLTLSPTQQDAIVSSRNAAALAPLAGYNEILKGQYGTIADMVGNAGNIYNASLQGAQTNAANLLDLYKAAIAEQDAKTKASGSGGIDIAAILKALGGTQKTTQQSLDEIFASKPAAKKAAPAKTPTQAATEDWTKLINPQGNGGFNWSNFLDSLKFGNSQPAQQPQNSPLNTPGLFNGLSSLNAYNPNGY